MPRSPYPDIAFSQNFLHDSCLVERLVTIANIELNDTVLEIGPGRGIITEALARRSRRVVAVEKDPRLAASLRDRYATEPRVEIRQGDALQIPLPRGPYKVVANIPFSITSEIVARLVLAPTPPDDAYLVVQREAAERYMGRPRGTLYAALLHPWFEISIAHRFRRADFAPSPAVETVLMRVRKRGPPLIGSADAQYYRDIVVYLFTAWQPAVRQGCETAIGTRATRRVERSLNVALNVPPSHLSADQWLQLFSHPLISNVRMRTHCAGADVRLRRQQRGLEKSHRTRL